MKKLFTFQGKIYLAEEWNETIFGEIRVSEYHPEKILFKRKDTSCYVKPIFLIYLNMLNISPKNLEELMLLAVKAYLELLET